MKTQVQGWRKSATALVHRYVLATWCVYQVICVLCCMVCLSGRVCAFLCTRVWHEVAYECRSPWSLSVCICGYYLRFNLSSFLPILFVTSSAIMLNTFRNDMRRAISALTRRAASLRGNRCLFGFTAARWCIRFRRTASHRTREFPFACERFVEPTMAQI